MAFKEITMGGKTFQVTEDMAAAFEAEMANSGASGSAPSVNSGPNYDHDPSAGDFDTDFWSNPQGYMQKMVNDAVKQAVTQSVQTVEKKTAQKSAEEKLWKKLFDKNPHLRSQEKFVKYLANENIEALKGLKTEGEIINKIADIANQEVAKSGKTPQTEEVFAEGSPQPSVERSSDSLDGEAAKGAQEGIASILRKRSASRRQARTNSAGRTQQPVAPTGTGES